MVARGTLGKYSPGKPSPLKYKTLVACLTVFSLVGGYAAGVYPSGGTWTLFSWHPLLMTVGMVGLAGIGAVTKKLGGYTNTKLHGLAGWASILVSFAGVAAIYTNKERHGYHGRHWQSNHARAGAFCVANCVLLGLAGGVFLHPDFGKNKNSKQIRILHRTFSRLTLIFAWATAFLGLFQLTQNGYALFMYGLPLFALVPFTLM